MVAITIPPPPHRTFADAGSGPPTALPSSMASAAPPPSPPTTAWPASASPSILSSEPSG